VTRRILDSAVFALTLAACAALAAITALAAIVAGAPAPPPPQPAQAAADDDPLNLRPQIPVVEKLLPALADRGAALFFLARVKASFGDPAGALALLRECVDLGQGFDPAGSPALETLRGDPRYDALAARARADSPVVSRARLAFTFPEGELIPEGLAFDPRRKVFYLGSLHLRKIVERTLAGKVRDFVPAGRDHLLPVLGIRVDPVDGTVWAATSDEEGRSELVHFDPRGRLLDRHAPPDDRKHELNDLAVRKNGDVFVSDSRAQEVYRFDRRKGSFSLFPLYRPTFESTNGITLSGDERLLFVADSLGVIRVDLATGASRDVIPLPGSTLAGADGLYWHRGSLVAVQNGIGVARVARFQLSADGRRVTRAEVLEQRTGLLADPTTGAVAGDDFYILADSEIANFASGRVVDPAKLVPVPIAVVSLRRSAPAHARR
jgi:sugar lactone lactonase YvrE